MPRTIPASPELVDLFEECTGHRPELVHWKGVAVFLSRDVSAALGYGFDAAPARVVRRVVAERRSQYLLYLDGDERRAFLEHAGPGLAGRARATGRLTLLTAGGLFEAACGASTPAGRKFRDAIVEACAGSGFGFRLLELVSTYGLDGAAALLEQERRPPALSVVPGGGGG